MMVVVAFRFFSLSVGPKNSLTLKEVDFSGVGAQEMVDFILFQGLGIHQAIPRRCHFTISHSSRLALTGGHSHFLGSHFKVHHHRGCGLSPYFRGARSLSFSSYPCELGLSTTNPISLSQAIGEAIRPEDSCSGCSNPIWKQFRR